MIRALLFGLLAFVLCSCATWQDKARVGMKVTFEVTKTTEGLTSDFKHAQCMKLAEACKAKWASADASSRPVEKEKACPEVAKCIEEKSAITSAAVAIYRVLAAGLIAVELGEKGGAADWQSKAATMLSQLRILADAAGLWR